MSIQDDIKRLRELAEKATPGPWDQHERNSNHPYAVVIETSRLKVADVQSTADIEFIAASRTAIPALCDALEASLKENAELKAKLNKCITVFKEAHAKGYVSGDRARHILKELGID